MIVWDGKDIIGLFILGVIVAIAIVACIVYAIKRGVDRAVARLRKEDSIDDEDTE